MTPQLLSALLWIVVVLTRPVRALAVLAADWLWPDLWPLRPLATLSGGRLPFVAFVAIGFTLATVAIAYSLDWAGTSRDPRMRRILRRHPPDGLNLVALPATSAWVIAAAAAGTLTLPLFVAALLIVIGLLGKGRNLPHRLPAPFPLPEPPRPLPSSEEDKADESRVDKGEWLQRTFEWEFNTQPYQPSGRRHSFTTTALIPRVTYEDFKKRPHEVRSDGDYVRFTDVGPGDPSVSQVAGAIREIVTKHQFDRLDEIHVAMAFTLSLRYAYDSDEYGGEYPKFPVETLVDQCGDCEDHAILCAVLLQRLGHRTGLVLMETPTAGHAAIAVESPEPVSGLSFYVPAFATDMFYAEVTPVLTEGEHGPTRAQWLLGQQPSSEMTNYKVYPLLPQA